MTGESDHSVDSPPSYSESLSSASVSTPTLPHNITQARTALISDLVTTQITPHLHSNALSGLSNTTLLIVPTNVPSLRSSQSGTTQDKSGSDATSPGETIVGFPSADAPTLIRLQGQENNLGFWAQSVVISELWHQLCSRLQSEGYRIARGCQDLSQEESSTKGSDSHSQARARQSDWRTVQKKHLQDGEANVEVGMQEITLRVENPLGLYETKTGKAVIVKVEIAG